VELAGSKDGKQSPPYCVTGTGQVVGNRMRGGSMRDAVCMRPEGADAVISSTDT
jgi:hypothetical protein